MIIVAAADLPPQSIVITEQVQIAKNDVDNIRHKTIGVCGVMPPITDQDMYRHTSSHRELESLENLAAYMLPKEVKQSLDNGDVRFWDMETRERFIAFTNQLTITQIKNPTHGKLEVHSGGGSHGVTYSLEKDYTGKDQAELLVTGIDWSGKPFSLTVIYYIHVTEEANKLRYYQANKKYCGTRQFDWEIKDHTGYLF
ncbi:MAG: hypothetical protein PHH11_10375 [Methylomonas sp.]|nr:hypothetical protein [Methylomonas sp.]